MDRLMDELQVLQDRLQIVNQEVGGAALPSKKPKKGDPFSWHKSRVVGAINDLNEACYARATEGSGSEKKRIKANQKVTKQLKVMQDAMFELEADFGKQLGKKKKKSKLTEEDIAERKQAITDLKAMMADAEEQATGHAPADTAPSYNVLSVNEHGELMSAGKPVEHLRPAGGAAAPLTGEQKAAMAQIAREEEKQDELLDQIGEGVDNLKTLAEGMREEAQLQNVMLTDLEQDVDNTQEHLNRVNDKMSETLKALNSKTDKFCSYVICFVILLGLLMVIFNMAT
mmetsp:Transcript_18537/g.43691  ORF Transcript_18537/g.43691 Transcript_18537/m.43691 type:complete len:285 (-) Transcript_18537:41-895(-)